MEWILNVPRFKGDYVEHLLEYKGINNIPDFINPKETSLQDPANLDQIEEGRKLIEKHKDSSNIGLIVDCDMDGYTSSSILYLYLKEAYPNMKIEYFIHEGKQHGLEDHLDLLDRALPFDLLLVPDAGTNDNSYIKSFKDYGTDILIIDHHELDDGNILSKDAVIINNQLSEKYKNKALSGSGMTWQFCRYIDSVNKTNYAEKYIDLAALGIVSDMMLVSDYENRYIIKHGFDRIRNDMFVALMRQQSFGTKGIASPMTISFYIAPLVNALIRVGTKGEKTAMFEAFINGRELVETSKRGHKGEKIERAVEVARLCTNARTRQNNLKDKVISAAEQYIDENNLLENKILFVDLTDFDDFYSSVNGLIAMGLASKYQRPTLIGRANSEGIVRGSVRGLSNIGLDELKSYLSSTGLFEYASGHELAFGYGIKSFKIDKFIDMSNSDLSNLDFKSCKYNVDFDFMANDPSISDVIYDLDSLSEIWGQGLEEPLIHIGNICINKSNIQILGSKNNTLKFSSNGIDYLKFNAEDMISEVIYNNSNRDILLEVVGKANLNHYRGMEAPQIFITDYNLVSKVNLEF